MTTTYDILIAIAGTPTDNMQAFVLYVGSIVITCILFFMPIYIMKVISQLMKKD